MIHLERVNCETFDAVVDMKVAKEQQAFVASNIRSLAQAWLYYEDARPYAVMDGQTPVGFVMLAWRESERIVSVWRLMIALEHQHKGYGRQTLEKVLEMARESGLFDVVVLDYVPENVNAKRLYESLGFAPNGEVEDGEIIMTLNLTDTPRMGARATDEDDEDDACDMARALKASGKALPAPFENEDALRSAVSHERAVRLNLYEKSVGYALDGALMLRDEGFRAQAEAALIRFAQNQQSEPAQTWQ